jgi:plasmid stability protein
MDDCAKQLGNPPTDAELAELSSRYETAKAAFDEKRYSSAAMHLKPLLEVKAACEVVRKARELASAIDSAGAAALAAAAELEKQKKWPEAVAAYAKVSSDFRGCAAEKAAAEARKRIQSDPSLRAAAGSKKIEADAKAILDAAVRYEKAEKYSAAIASYERVVDMGETPSLAKAEEALKRLRADESVMKAVKAEEAAREARSLWARANSWASSNQAAKAIPLLRELLAKYPDSEYAPRAEAKLKELESK